MEPYLLSSTINSISIQPVTLTAYICIALSVFFLGASAFISASEVAFFSLAPKELNEMEESNDNTDRKILRLLENPQRLLATILIGSNFVNITFIILLSFFANSVFNFSNSPLWGFILQTIAISFLVLLFGEITPKIYATQYARKTARKTASLLAVLEKLFGPFVSLLVNSTSIVNTRLAKHSRNNISIDELSQALELTSDSRDEDTGMLEGIINFGNIQVVDIMTSRVDMVDIDIKTSYKQLIDIIIKCGYSRIPIYSGTRDNIKGILYGKDLLPHLDKPANFRWQSLVRPAYYVPETKKIDDLTLEDILEEIVGDISDEYDVDEALYTKLDNHTFVFEAKIQLNDFFKIEEIDANDFVKISGEVETLAGLILEIKGEIPSKKERIDYGRYVFEIMAVDNRRIKKIKLYIKDDFRKGDD